VKPSRTWAVARKEFFHIYRDPRSLALVILMPAILMLLFGYAVTLDVKNVPLAVLDHDRSQESLSFVHRFSASPYFYLRIFAEDERQIKQLIDQGEVKMGLVLSWDFSRTIKAGKKAAVQVLLDGTDSNTANIILSYVQAIARQYNQEKTSLKVERMGRERLNPPVETQARVWFNEELESKNYFIPGLVAVIISIIGVLLTGQVIVREWEKGTMELLISTPVRKRELMIGKLFPYFFLGLLDLSLAVWMGKWVFQVPFRGSIILLLSLSSIYVLFHLCPRCLGSWFDHLDSGKDPDSGQSDGHGDRFSSHVPLIGIYVCHCQYADLASNHYLRNCASVLCDHRQRDFSEGSQFLISLEGDLGSHRDGPGRLLGGHPEF